MVSNVKVKHDGTRCLIAIENCVGETAELVNRCLLAIMGMTDPEEAIPAVVPMPENRLSNALPDFDEVEQLEDGLPEQCNTVNSSCGASEDILSEGEYKGMSVHAAIEKGGIDAVIQVLYLSKNMPEQEKAIAVELCKKYILADLDKVDIETATTYSIKSFIDAYMPLLKDGIRQILNQSGYSSIDDFLNFADIEMQQDAYERLVENLRERIK